MATRIGAVSYLNTKPLIYGMREWLPDADLILDLPSKLADRLAQGDLDVALVPSVEFLRRGEWTILSDACIASRGPVRSVRVLFRKEPSQVETLSLDVGSRTSAVLAQVLLAQRFGIQPQIRLLGMRQQFMQDDADAIVIIGDRAMSVDQSNFVEVWDLGEQWMTATGLPFVFAMWVTPHASLPFSIGTALGNCRDQGLACVDDIALAEAPRFGLTAMDCRTYFTEQLYFRLGDSELQGLDLFRTQAAALGLLPASCTQLSLQSK